MGEWHTHICPECGRHWECDWDDCTEDDWCLPCKHAKILEQRNELLAACEEALDTLENYHAYILYEPTPWTVERRLKSVIAKVKGAS